jgi:hypothetical protein
MGAPQATGSPNKARSPASLQMRPYESRSAELFTRPWRFPLEPALAPIASFRPSVRAG